MGLNFFESELDIDNNINPNPYNYKILKYEFINNYLLLLINYPDCKNFKGNKILVFKNITLRQLIHKEVIPQIDPHFPDNNKYSPIARFIPTEEGYKIAKQFCKII